MLLRRVINHFRKQEWTAIALDFLIVVAGILIAFQITEWSEIRRNKEEEYRYRHDLAEDLKADIAEIDETVAAAISRAAAAKAVLDELGISAIIGHRWVEDVPKGILPETLVAESRATVMRELGHTRVLDGNSSTYDELVNTGKIGILSDRDLIRALAQYYAFYNSEQDGDEINRHFQLRILDYYQDHGLAQYDNLPFGTVVAMADDPVYLGHVKAAYVYGLWQIARTLRLKSEAEKALAAVQQPTERLAP